MYELRSPIMMLLPDNHHQENALENLLEKYESQITGTLSCFDRVIFKGYLPLGWPDARESLLARQGPAPRQAQDPAKLRCSSFLEYEEPTLRFGRPFSAKHR